MVVFDCCYLGVDVFASMSIFAVCVSFQSGFFAWLCFCLCVYMFFCQFLRVSVLVCRLFFCVSVSLCVSVFLCLIGFVFVCITFVCMACDLVSVSVGICVCAFVCVCVFLRVFVYLYVLSV